MPVIPALGRYRQKGCIQDPVSKIPTKQKEFKF
jgi:hypothetical protein